MEKTACTLILFLDGTTVKTVRQFQDTFNVDARHYGFDGDYLDECLCYIDVDMFFAVHTEYGFFEIDGDWWQE